MYLKNTSNEVKELVIKINELDRDDKLKFISYVFNLWDRDQINSLSEVNPSLLDDSIDIEIFNPSSIDYHYLVIEIKEYWNYKYSLYRLYPKKYKQVISYQHYIPLSYHYQYHSHIPKYQVYNHFQSFSILFS